MHRKVAHLASVSAIFSLTACGGYSTPPAAAPQTATRSVAAAAAKPPILYFADDDNQAVYLLDANNITGPVLRKITNGINTPVAVAVDTKGVLYVGNQTGEVQVFEPGATTPSRSIKPQHGAVSSIAVSPDGTLVIASGGFFTDGGLLIFDKGSSTPTRSILLPLKKNDIVFASAGISSNDLIDYSVHRYPRLDAGNFTIAPGSLQSVRTGLLPDTVGGFDAAGNLYMTTGSEIDAYHSGAKAPFRRITKGITGAAAFAVGSNGALYVPNLLTQNAPGSIVKYTAHGSAPVATRTSPDDPYPVSAALGPPLP